MNICIARSRRFVVVAARIVVVGLGFIIASSRLISAESMKTEDIKLIASELQRCPCWLEVPSGEEARRKAITDIYLRVAGYDTDTVRAGIASYLNEQNPHTYFEAIAKVFALLRVVFRVPQWVAADGNFYGMGNPIRDGSFELLWPFSMDRTGHLILSGRALAGYTGLPADPLKEFDKFASRFGRRTGRPPSGSSAVLP
jgi:hypothetical protein